MSDHSHGIRAADRRPAVARRQPAGRWLLVALASGALALSVLGAPRPAAQAAGRDDAPPAPTTVEFELLRSLHMAVQVKLNDAGPYRLIFDLGSPVVLVSGRAAAEAGLISAEAAKRPAFFGMRGESRVKKLELGELTVADVPVVVMDHPTIKAAAEVLGPLDGIIGYPVFARYRFTIDYPASTIAFEPNGYEPQDVMQRMMGRMFGSRAGKSRLAARGLWGIELAPREDGDEPGVTVRRVWPAGPADAAGMRGGDRLLTIDGRWTESPADALYAASVAPADRPVVVALRRGDEHLELELRPRTGL